MRHGAKLEIKKKVVHIESARRQIMHIVLLKRLVTIMVSSTTHPSNKTKRVLGYVFVGERSNFKKIPMHTQDHGDA